MPWYDILGIMVGGIILLMSVGVPVPFAFITTNIVSAYFFMGGVEGVIQVAVNATASVTQFVLITIPMFVLMGELFFRTRIVVRVFDTLEMMLGSIPGRLSYLTVAVGTIFSALIGSSMANTAMLGSLLVPEMTRRGYKPQMSIGPIMGTGGLAMIIPPSGLAVLLGSLASIDIGALLIAGVLPGLLLALTYGALIFTQVKLDPAAAPTYAVARPPAAQVVRAFVLNVLPMGLVIFCVIGLILLGWAGPTESAAFGVLAVLLLAATMRSLNGDVVIQSLRGTVRITGSLFLIIVGSSTFSQILAFSGASSGLIDFATTLHASPLAMLLIMFGVLLILGCLMDSASILLLTVPVFFPLATLFHFDLIWFGIIILISLEMSGLTPPFGMSLFIMMSVAPRGTTFGLIVRAGLPYLVCDLIVVGLIIAIPAISTYLPSLIGG
jgi:tripartite ATP-independent transporter DctM subunit